MTTFEEFKSSLIEKISKLLDENHNIKKKDFLASIGSFYTELKKKNKKPSQKEIAITKIVEKWHRSDLTRLINKIKIQKIQKYQKERNLNKNKLNPIPE